MAGPETRRRLDRAMNEIEGTGHRVLERVAERQTRGDSGRQRAAGTVRRGGLDFRVAESAEAGRRCQDIGDALAREMAAFYENGGWAKTKHGNCGTFHRGH